MRPIWRAFIGVVTGALILALTPAAAMAQRPDVTRAPAMGGVAHIGQQLTAVGATWTGRAPVSVTYIWLRCEDEGVWSCEFVEGPRQPVYTISSRDVGSRLRVVVYVSNRDGNDYAWSQPTSVITSEPSALPPAAPAPPAPVPQPAPVPAAESVATLMSPRPLVRIRGWLTPGGAMLTHLTVRTPRGASIRVRCFGSGCPRERLARTAKVTRLRAFEGRMRAGTRLVIRVTRAGFIGKYTSIRIRRGKQPARRDLCIYPGTRRPAKCPAG